MRMIFLLLLGLFLLTGCSHKVKVNALQPAKIDRVSRTKIISVYDFGNDSVGLSSKIEAALASKRIEGKNYFTLISPRDLERIFSEQRLQDSGLLDESSSVELGNILGAQALISGIVSNAHSIDDHYREKRRKCVDKACKELYEYLVSCTRRAMNVSAQIKMVDIEKGDIIYSEMFRETHYWRTCSDKSYALPTPEQGLGMLSSNLAHKFASQLTPSYKTFYVTLLDELDIDYSDEEEKMLENALTYIDHKRYAKAEELLSRLLDRTQEHSFVAAYNLGVLKEIQGELQDAKQLYSLADELTIEPIEEIDLAMNRIDRSIRNREVVRKQMNR